MKVAIGIFKDGQMIAWPVGCKGKAPIVAHADKSVVPPSKFIANLELEGHQVIVQFSSWAGGGITFLDCYAWFSSEGKGPEGEPTCL